MVIKVKDLNKLIDECCKNLYPYQKEMIKQMSKGDRIVHYPLRCGKNTIRKVYIKFMKEAKMNYAIAKLKSILFYEKGVLAKMTFNKTRITILNKRIKPKFIIEVKKYIPHGWYCYKTLPYDKNKFLRGLKIKKCPFYQCKYKSDGEPIGICHYLQEYDGDEMGNFILWDMVKSCYINYER